MRLTYVGHATVLIEMDVLTRITDPVLRARVGHLRRHGMPPPPSLADRVDAVLLSHLHPDHLDKPSLAQIDPGATVIAPTGAAGLLGRYGRRRIIELEKGSTTELHPFDQEGSWATPGVPVRVTATDADHDGGRPPFGPAAEAVGFVISGSHRVYFAGDTDFFAGMEGIGSSENSKLDVALVPVWGWGATLGPGHLDPEGAAKAVSALKPRVAIPIHWGTLFPIGMGHWSAKHLKEPPLRFRDQIAALCPEVEVRVLAPGESTDIEP